LKIRLDKEGVRLVACQPPHDAGQSPRYGGDASEDVHAAMNRKLGHDVSGGTKAVNPEPLGVPCFS
jgi:hypothetical protein